MKNFIIMIVELPIIYKIFLKKSVTISYQSNPTKRTKFIDKKSEQKGVLWNFKDMYLETLNSGLYSQQSMCWITCLRSHISQKNSKVQK